MLAYCLGVTFVHMDVLSFK